MARRLLLSYLAVIVLTVALLGIIVRVTTAQTFSRYLSDQASTHTQMLPTLLASYHAQHGSWEGVQANIEQASFLIGGQVALADAQGRIVAASQPTLIGQQVGRVGDLGTAIPIVASGGTTAGTVYVGRSLALKRADTAFLANITLALAAAGLLVALLATGLSLLLARSISRPLAEMGQAAARMAKGDYQVRVPPGQAEVGALAEAFNLMAEGMGGVERLRRELVANVSHDLRTPLTVIRGYLEGLRSGQIADRRSAEMAFEAMYGEVARLLVLVEDLRQVASLDAEVRGLERQPVTADALATTALGRIEPLAVAKGVKLTNQVPSDLAPVLADPSRLGQALYNLLENAVRHTPAGGQITISAGQTVAHDGGTGQFWLAVRDNGDGISAEHLPHVFERFYQVDPARSSQRERGSGLGLTIAKGIVEAHGGWLTAESEGVPGRGSIFTIRLPL
jgi:two-component system, OmpR family, sensor histidine kinase BaeS